MFSDAIRRLKYLQLNSSMARKLLALYYAQGRAYRIPFGQLRGTRLRYDNDINYHMMLGLWEPANLTLLKKVFDHYWAEQDAPLVVCDVGANVGFFTLWFARQVSDQGTVYAFEPAPVALARLREHLVLNRIPNVEVLPYACSDREGTIDFYVGFHHHSSSLDAQWANGSQSGAEKISVPTTTLDRFFVEEGRPLPHLIKMDIEGGGTLALKGCRRLAAERRPLLLIESHTPAEDRAISDLILEQGYHAFRVTNMQWVTQPSKTHPHPDGVWGTLLLCPSGTRSTFETVLF